MGEHAVTAVVATWPGEDGQPEVHFEVSGLMCPAVKQGLVAVVLPSAVDGTRGLSQTATHPAGVEVHRRGVSNCCTLQAHLCFALLPPCRPTGVPGVGAVREAVEGWMVPAAGRARGHLHAAQPKGAARGLLLLWLQL